MERHRKHGQALSTTAGSIIDSLREEIENAKDILVIVEGPNDKRSLEHLGFRDVVIMDGPLYKIVESYENKEELLLLTDLDEHGKGLYKFFYHEFTRRGVCVNNRLRILLLQTPVKQIEGLAHYIEGQDAMARR